MNQGLGARQCQPCRAGAAKMTERQINEHLALVSQWQLVESDDGIDKIFRVFKFKDFAQALHFVVQVGEAAEEEGHHPDILLQWGRVTVTWYSHKLGGLHENDFIMAARTNRLYAG